MLTDKWKSYVLNIVKQAQVDLSSSAAGALIFRSSKEPSELLGTSWDMNREKAFDFLYKVSTEKQEELYKHCIIPFDIELIPENRINFSDLLLAEKTTEEIDDNMVGFVRGMKQGIPVYPDVTQHVEDARIFVNNKVARVLKGYFPQYVYIFEDHNFINLALLLEITSNRVEFYESIADAKINLLVPINFEEKKYDVKVIQHHSESYWVSFLINARRSVIKDFSLFSDCFCTRISSGKEKSLDRKSSEEYTHLVTIVDVPNVLKDMKLKLVETETLEILELLKNMS